MQIVPDQTPSEAKNGAAEMLAGALREYTSRHRGGLRSLAAKLGFKQATVLSHMANGRMAIPVDRAPLLARQLGMDEARFTWAVFCQRYPDAAEVLGETGSLDPPTVSGAQKQLAPMLASIKELSPERLEIIADVIRDPNPAERWLAFREVATVRDLRRLRPLGLSRFDQEVVYAVLSDNRDQPRTP